MLHYTTLITPHRGYNCNCACKQNNLHYITATAPLHYNYSYSCNYNCATPHYIQQLWARWPLQPLQPFQKTQLQPPFGPSVDSLCHPWFTTTNLSYRLPIFWNFRRCLVRYYWYKVLPIQEIERLHFKLNQWIYSHLNLLLPCLSKIWTFDPFSSLSFKF